MVAFIKKDTTILGSLLGQKAQAPHLVQLVRLVRLFGGEEGSDARPSHAAAFCAFVLELTSTLRVQ